MRFGGSVVALCLRHAVASAFAVAAAVAGHAAYGQNVRVLHLFGQAGDGSNPQAGLSYRGGSVYGTTYFGGSVFQGAVFKIALSIGVESVLYSFSGGSDGASPGADLTWLEGAYYSTTEQGGAAGNGTVFRFDPRSGDETVISTLGLTSTDPAGPTGSLLAYRGALYGVTGSGGTAGQGTVFKTDLATGITTALYSFNGGSDGAYPYGSLVEVNGAVYGTTAGGGVDNHGTVFKLDAATGAETVLHRFTGGRDGSGPRVGLIEDGGLLFGTTSYGGGKDCGGIGCGILFSIDPVTGTETILHRFRGNGDGATPSAPLIRFGGALYGTTAAGGVGGYCGSTGCGTVFKLKAVDRTRRVVTVVHSFDGFNDGQYPTGPVVTCGAALCGTTTSGGDYYNGTAYMLTPSSDSEPGNR